MRYRIKSCTLITYSGIRIPCETTTDILCHPIKILKELVLDSFKSENSDDPIIDADIKIQTI